VRAALTLVAGLVVAMGAAPSPAGAHAALVAASPARRATVPEPPRHVELTFSERLEGAYARLTVENAGGTRVDRGDAALASADGRRLRVSLPPLEPGTYTVRFRVLSVDGHVIESSFVFTVRDRSAGAAPR
jgi:copper resistance protein C